jgi:uncharacterized protein YjiS (DUF1127 family)
MERSERAATILKEPVMSQMISRKSDSFQFRARSEPSLGWSGGLVLGFSRAVVRTLRRAWATHTDERLLQEMSDHQLRDIGIRREHIPHVVRHGWDF